MRRNESGLTLIELLVAVTILAIGTLVAFQVYDSARRSYKIGNDLSHQQQLARVTFDLVARDLRVAGFNTNPDGDEDRPDEQIEAALATAIVIRADFDADDPALSTVPETALAGGAFSSVSTGNDEIRIYALQKPDGSSVDTLTFSADVVPAARDGVVESIDVPAVDLAQADPPYTLYRMTLNNDPGQFGGSGFVNKTLIAENVRSLRFRYLDAAGAEITPPGGAETAAAISARRAIHSIEVSVDLLTPDPDPTYFDTNDPVAATRGYRKLELASRVTPRNLRRRGIRDLVADTTSPAAPGIPDLYPGHCGGLYIDWPPCDASEGVAYYRVYLGTDAFQLDRQRYAEMPGLYFGDLDHDTFYYVGIQAVDESGNPSTMSSLSSVTTTDSTMPTTPTGVWASENLTNEIRLTWDPVSTNSSNLAGDPDSPLLRDGAGYRIYRSRNRIFSVGSQTLLVDENVLPLMISPEFVDTSVVACARYYYKVLAVDECGRHPPFAPRVSGVAQAVYEPEAPVHLRAERHPTSLQLSWGSSDVDSTGMPITIESYHVYRAFLAEGTPPTVPGDFSFIATVDTRSTGTTFEDFTSVPPGMDAWYAVQATDECSPPNGSAYSNIAREECQFSGDLEFVSPTASSNVSGITTVELQVTGGSGTYEELRLTFTSRVDGSQQQVTIPGIASSWSYSWDTSSQPPVVPGLYRITAEVDERLDPTTICTDIRSIPVTVAAN